jgi:hypothetical protein
MRVLRISGRGGLVGACAVTAALPLALSSPASAAGISVSTAGSTVSVATTSCKRVDGSFGNASLLSPGQSRFAQGRQVALSQANGTQSAAWSNVGRGTFTVVVVCADGSTAGTQPILVSPSATSRPPTTPAAPVSPAAPAAPAPATSPSLGVMGGAGGSVQDHGTLARVAGGVLAAAGAGASVWYLRRRTRRPRRL